MSFDAAIIVKGCSPLGTAIPVVALATFILLARFQPTVAAAVGLRSLAPLFLIATAGLVSIVSWRVGEARINRLAALQLLENAFYTASFVAMSAFCEPPASHVFAVLFAVICVYWGLYFSATLIGTLGVLVPIAVFAAAGLLDIVSTAGFAVGLVLFFTSGSMTAHRRRRDQQRARSRDAFASLEELIAQQSAAAEHQVRAQLAVVVHELKNQLLPPRMDLAKALGMIPNEVPRALAERSLSGIDRLLDYMRGVLARESAMDDAPVFALDELREEVERLSAEREGRGEIELTPLPPVLAAGRADLMALCLRNLVCNAFEAGARKVTIEGAMPRDRKVIRLSIGDDGPGLPPPVRRSLFEPYNTHGKPHGVGLGIYLSAQIVRAAGGRIELARTGPNGTVYLMELPVFDPLTGSPYAVEEDEPGSLEEP